jgi:hypothetical protein
MSEKYESRYGVGYVVYLDGRKDFPMTVTAVLFDGCDQPQYKLQWINNGIMYETWAVEWRISE